MGLFDLPAPLFGAIDGLLAGFLPAALRLALWGVLAGWLTMVVYRRLSNQQRIGELKAEQKQQQQVISNFDGEFNELLPLIRSTLGLGFKQLGLSLGPALLATIPVLFLVAWVAGQFGYRLPPPGQAVTISTEPAGGSLQFSPGSNAITTEQGWQLPWPSADQLVSISLDNVTVMTIPPAAAVPVVHKKQWWNLLFANPLGYLDDSAPIDVLQAGLPAQQFIAAGPGWVRGWMFLFFGVFLLSSVAFKFLLKID
jgi:hypothetical protein